MSRTSNDEIRNGAVYNGFDYNLQVWVQDGIVRPCAHPLTMGANCCNQRRFAGDALASLHGREQREEEAKAPALREAVQEVYDNLPRTAENAWAIGVLRKALIATDGGR